MQRLTFQGLDDRVGSAHVHVTRLKGPQLTARHTHDFYEVFLVLEGTGLHHLNRHKVRLEPGHLVVIRPQDAHCFSCTGSETLIFVNIAVSAAWWKAFHTLLGLADWGDDHRSAMLAPGDTKRLGGEMSGAGLTENPLVLIQVWQRVRELILRPERKTEINPPAWLETLRRSLVARPESLVEPISYWQQRSGRSPEHLARSCRRFFGVTFSELINQARIERACYLLRTTDEKVITIAFECGFENMAHFHRVFARLTGRTPGSWRSAGTATVPFL